MKKHLLTISIVAFSAIRMLAADVNNTCPDQSEFPVITCQPVDQLVPFTSNATFTVEADNGPLTYQWLRNGNALPGETNSSLTIANAGIGDVGRYACNVSKDLEIVPTRAAQLMVYTNTIDPQTGIDPILVFAMPLVGNGSSGNCPGAYAGYVSFTKAPAQGWGWNPSTNTTIHTVTDTNRADTKVEYSGKKGDRGCAQTGVSVSDPAYSTAYRFAIYFTNNVPTNSYSIVLDGFDP